MGAIDARDVVGAIGLLLIAAGVGMLSVAAALTLIGVVLLGLAIVPPLIVAQRRRRAD